MNAALPSYDEALAAALRLAQPLARTESLPLAASHGRVLAKSIHADRDLPPFHRAQMDGYALRASDLRPDRAFSVVAEIAAGMSADVRVPAGACVKIATGAPLPADVDTVIPHEQSDRGDPVHFAIDGIAPGNAVHPHGADARRGDQVIAAGILLASRHLGIAAAVGANEVLVQSDPSVIILTSGDEVKAVDSRVEPHQIRNSNGIMLRALLNRMNAHVLRHEHVRDDRHETVEAVVDAVERCDLLITVGGISAGDRDFFADAFDEAGVEFAVRGAAIQPGKPITIGRSASGTIVVGLPGNPVSALVCACLFAWPIMRRLSHLPSELPWRATTVVAKVQPNAKRQAFRPAMLDASRNQIMIPDWHGSGDLVHTAPTDGIIVLPVRAEPVTAGTSLQFLPWP